MAALARFCAIIADLKPLIKILTVEPYLFFIFFAFLAKQNTYTQFYQDKVCVVTYHMSNEICSVVASSKDINYVKVKDAIITDANDLNSWQSVLRTVPGIIFTILLAPWADKVKGARRKLMILSALGQLADSALGIVSIMYEDTFPAWTALCIGIPSSLVGAMLAINISTLGYASMTTPIAQMPLRFIILDISANACRPLTTYLSGVLLGTPSWIPGKVRNFSAMYILCLVSSLLALIWTLVFIDDSDWKGDPNDKTEREAYRFFNKENFLQLKNTLMKKRDNLGRIQLWLLIAINGFAIFVMVGPSTIMLSFAQLVYRWDVVMFNKTSAYFAAVTFVLFSIFSPMLTTVLKLTEPQLGIFGLSWAIIYLTTKGTILHPWGFYVAAILGTFGSVGGAAVRSKVSKLVSNSEKSSAFALISIFQNLFTLVASWFYPPVFKYTMHSMPGFAMQSTTSLLFCGMACWIWIDFHTLRTAKDTPAPVGEKDGREVRDVIIMETRL
ncbi:Proton-coupled folate transporter [Halotydeus destructor]|nr:Proton-coupled folate transporter [Halotydeus destructor]